jgi:methionyl-tRNA synthetase
VNTIIYHCAEATRIVGILLQPYMPTKSAELLDLLGVDMSRRSFKDAQYGADLDFGVPMRPVGSGRWDGLFPPLPVES